MIYILPFIALYLLALRPKNRLSRQQKDIYRKAYLSSLLVFLCLSAFSQTEQRPYRSPIPKQVVDSAQSVRQLRIPSFTGQSLNGYQDLIGQSFGINKTNNRLSVRGNGVFLDYPSYSEVLSLLSSGGTVTNVSRTTGYGITVTIANPTTMPNILATLDTAGIDDAVSKSRLTAALALYGKLNLANTFTANQIVPRLAIGGTNLTATLLRIDGNLSGGTTAQVVQYNGEIQSGVTTSARVFRSAPTSVNGVFTTASLVHLDIANLSKGASHTLTNQYGIAIADLTAGTSNYGVFSSISSGTGKWNIYMTGTAANYFNGTVLMGSASDNSGGAKLQVTGKISASVAPTNASDVVRKTELDLKADISSGVVSSAATLALDVTKEGQVFTGTTSTWTLPVIAANTWKRLYLKNRGSGTLTINANGGTNTIFTTSAVSTFSLNTGESVILLNDGVYWLLY